MVATISKEELSELPVEVYSGRIHVVNTAEQAEQAVEVLSQHNRLGFDTETKPSFVRGQHHKMALIQLATDTEAYLFRLNVMKTIPECLISLFQDETILKIGLALQNDLPGLAQRGESLKGFIDIQKIAPQHGIQELSLQKIYAILFGKRISKSQRVSNWSATELTEAQKAYAAIDAWACLRIYNLLNDLK